MPNQHICAQLVNCPADHALIITQLMASFKHCSVNLSVDQEIEQAQEKFLRNAFDIVVVGTEHNHAQALAFIRWIHSCEDQLDNFSNPAILALSDQDSVTAYQQLLLAGVDDTLPMDELVSALLEDTFLQLNHQVTATRKLVPGNNSSQTIKNADTYQKQLSADIGHAILRGEFQLYFQPIVSTSDLSICGAEALLRWQHPYLGLLTPEDFFTPIKQPSLINSIGCWVLRRACEQHLDWIKHGLPAVPIAINLSPIQLDKPALLNTLDKIIDEQEFDVSYLTIELSEADFYQCNTQARNTLSKLHEMHIDITIDNFGKESCSLEKLQDSPIDNLKIDRSLIQSVGIDDDDAAVAETIIELGKSMQCKVIAQGVDNLRSFDFLHEALCERIQGYGISEPLSAADFHLWYDNFSIHQPTPALY